MDLFANMHMSNNTIAHCIDKMKDCKYHILIRNLDDEENDILDDTFSSKEVAKEHIMKILHQKMSEYPDSSIEGVVDAHEDEDEEGNPIDVDEQTFSSLDAIALWFDKYTNAAICIDIKTHKIQFSCELSFGPA